MSDTYTPPPADGWALIPDPARELERELAELLADLRAMALSGAPWTDAQDTAWRAAKSSVVVRIAALDPDALDADHDPLSPREKRAAELTRAVGYGSPQMGHDGRAVELTRAVCYGAES